MSDQINESISHAKPDFLFEVSWEVCNKVGGIHTVIATKALTMTRKMEGRYIAIGPDVHRDGRNPEFKESASLLKEWRQAVYNSGIRIRVGRWNVEGSPTVVLVDFSSMIAQKDDVLKFLWETYRVDSISGQWDYLEPVLFGYAAGKVIESYIDTFCSTSDRVVAHFHEWMTGSGGLYLRKSSPYTATVFTTHATILGRSIAGNGLPLYGGLPGFNADDLARQYGIVAKHSLERTSANNFDCFATVSDITARECKYLLGRKPDIVTPNGFEDDFVWKGGEFDKKRNAARAIMKRVAEGCLGVEFRKEPLIVGTSGRYEFKNKGLDVLVESLKKLAGEHTDREILAYITVPAGNNGPRRDLQAWLRDPENNHIDESLYRHTTHYLAGWDPIVNAMEGSALLDPASRVKVVFVPSYLNGDDGIFNKTYYELLAGMDVTVFASYYEPWGYTPLESVAFSVPTITTTLAGFGLWIDKHTDEHRGVEVIERTDTNDDEVVESISAAVRKFAAMTADEYESYRSSALELSHTALWENLVEYYDRAYSAAIQNSAVRAHRELLPDGGAHSEQINFVRQQLASNRPTWTRLMIEKSLPERLRPLEVLSRNLWWSWTSGAHELFDRADPELWAETGRNPIALLDRLTYARVKELEEDVVFLEKMDAVYGAFVAYMAEKKDAQGPTVAYFSMEYGLHNSLKIYSGGLGILAGDYLKEASDKNVPMVAVGLLYRYGYFTQKLSAQGAQEAGYEAQNFYKLPISPVRDEAGGWSSIQLSLPGRMVTARIWKCEVGRTDLYLLDTDHDLNMDDDRSITHFLYGGDWENRLKQEILLGVGGIRALAELGIEQNIYHCNEGHAALLGIERIRNLVDRLSFSEALEVVRSSALFTTHTPVPAGHDAFPESMMRQYISHYPDRLGITWEQFINLGKTNPNDASEKFSMSALACNLSQEVNGVSWLHGEVSKEILGNMWPGYFRNELHIGYVTNGVHFHTWTAPNLRNLYMKYFPEGFMRKQYDIPAWQKVHEIGDSELWCERMLLKDKLIRHIRTRLADPKQFKFASPSQMVKTIESFSPDVLTIGFARRFATYKRANLLFTNLDRLDSIVNNPQRPVQFVFAGKAHPNDKPGQDLIRRIVEISSMPRFAGKIIFLQNYDMALARKMVQGVDVWLNTPTRPQEASGTSGEKAVMNGVLQFSVLDGWWVEGYKEGAGWMLPMENTYEDPGFQNELDAEMIYTTIEEQIVPLYYKRDERNIPFEWVRSIKKCIADIAANFTTNRMLTDYQERFYDKLFRRNTEMRAGDFRMAREIAAWKRRVSKAWDEVHVVSVEQFDMGREAIMIGNSYHVEVSVDIDGLRPEDIGVELIMANQIDHGSEVKILDRFPLEVVGVEGSVVRYMIDSIPSRSGSFDTAIRIFPQNGLLPHRMDFALVKWA